MKAIILVAGYATRLYPLTKYLPKSLLDINGKPLLSYIIDDIVKIQAINEVVLVSNHVFYNQFLSWKQLSNHSVPISIIDDGTVSNDTRLGALKDLYFAIDSYHIDEDILVLAGDNLYDFEMQTFVDFFMGYGHDCIMIHKEEDISQLRKTGVAEVFKQRLVSFQEKPQYPKGTYAVPPFYIYRKDTLPLIKMYIHKNLPADSPGSMISWLLQHKPIYCFSMPGKRYDIGDIESYQEVKNVLSPR
jgi:glucose-1-phosphate thymidylyltransferase